jgi:hypothetical protein
MANIYHLPPHKNYANDAALLREYFSDFINEQKQPNVHNKIGNHFFHTIHSQILGNPELASKLEFLHDFAKVGLSVHHINIFLCRPGVVGGLHIDNVRDPRFCSLNLSLEGTAGSRVVWVRHDQIPMPTHVNVKIGHNTSHVYGGLPDPALITAIDKWDIVEEADFGDSGLLRTNTWHAIDNRENTDFRVALAIRFEGNPKFEDVLNKLAQLAAVQS